MHQLIIVGGGPSGLSAALSAQGHRLDYLVLERKLVANTIHDYPVEVTLFSTSDEVELERGYFPAGYKPTREQVLSHYVELVNSRSINIRTGEEVDRVTRECDGFTVQTRASVYRAANVILAIGGFGLQRRLNIPGEAPQRVSYRFIDPAPYAGRKVLVVGGGNSAAEAALALSRAGAAVTLSIRRRNGSEAAADTGDKRPWFPSRIKPWVREPLEKAVAEGKVTVLAPSEVESITARAAILNVEAVGRSRRVEVDCDEILALIGADPDTRLLERAGAEIAEDGRPVYKNETYETTVPGLYIAGHITRERHIRNAISVAQRVVGLIASQLLVKV